MFVGKIPHRARISPGANMKVFEEKYKLVLPTSHGRSVGLHISEVIRDYALTMGTLDAKWVSDLKLEDQNTNMMQIGLAWENYLALCQHPGIEFHPGELMGTVPDFCECNHDVSVHRTPDDVCDWACTVIGCECMRFRELPIFMSPDGISMIDRDDYADLFYKSPCGHFLHEFKFTRKSSRDFVELLQTRSKKALMWLWQIECYCYAMQTLAAKLHVMFVNGNYSYDDKDEESGSSYKIFRLEFTQWDLDQTWKKFTNHAKTMALRKAA